MGVAPVPDGYLVSMADITRLKELDRLKTELVANVSHELRSPLASIKAYTELLLDGLVPDEATERRFLAIIDGQAERLSQCIGNLLDLARVEAEGYVVSRERFSLRSFAREAVEAVSLRAQSKEIELDVSVPEGDVLVNGDRPILFSSLKNLLDNAVKYSGPGTRVSVSFNVSDEGLTVIVDDEGAGIPDDELERIFEKFYRVSAAQGARPEGSGLGLVIAREAARVHGGDVTVASRVGEGSSFSLFLPAYMIERSSGAP
jgi:two-component system phosphate regulon sensor histidine kinase PhoR